MPVMVRFICSMPAVCSAVAAEISLMVCVVCATACTTAVTQGMEIETDTPELERARRGILEMLVRKYPASAFALSPDKPFHLYGIEQQAEIARHAFLFRCGQTIPDGGSCAALMASGLGLSDQVTN